LYRKLLLSWALLWCNWAHLNESCLKESIAMLKLLLVLYKRPDLEWERFQQAWDEIYGPNVARVPGARSYKHHYLLPDPVDQASIADAIAELWFDSPEALHAGLASGVGQAALVALMHVLDAHRFKLMVREEQL
jgi:uncharacterized protein (TIGR02118 family)